MKLYGVEWQAIAGTFHAPRHSKVDIFIGYSLKDSAHAEAPAKDLQRRGYRISWDAEPVGSDDDVTDAFVQMTTAALAFGS